VRRIGVLMAYAESAEEGQAVVEAFRQELQKLGWTDGRNLQIDYRWAAVNAEAMERFAKELVALLVAGPSLQELLNPVDFKR
jgi:putative ABC transport system substrate-binding protein